jgi:tetratricopeptide (TPR) repeat protein
MAQEYRQASALPSQVVEEDFGAFLSRVRRRYRMQILEVVDYLHPYLPKWDRFTYSRIESGRRAPRLKELATLYRGLVLGCGMAFHPNERQTYLDLARKKIEGKYSHRGQQATDVDWRHLSIQLAEVDYDSASQKALALTTDILPDQHLDATTSSTTDIRYIVGRDDWLAEMLTYYYATAKKLIVVQGPLGSGKSSCWDLLLHELIQQNPPATILTFHGQRPRHTSMSIKPEEFLEQVLGTLQTELRMKPLNEDMLTKTITSEASIEKILRHLVESPQRVILLIDDGEALLREDGQLSESWVTFLESFLHYKHKAIIYLMTREWPGWQGMDQAFVKEAPLPALRPEHGAQHLRDLGSEFQQLAATLLEQLSERCGGNPFLIECCASMARKPLLTFSWRRKVDPMNEKGSDVEQALHDMLEVQSMLTRDVALEKRSLLAKVIRSRISQDTKQLLQALAVATVPLATPLLHSMCQNPQLAVEDLFHASLARILGPERIQVLPVVTEAVVQRLSIDETHAAEGIVVEAYHEWIETGDFYNEQEMSQVVTELAVLLLKHQRLIAATQLLIRYGWLSFTFGHGSRLTRLAQEELQHSWREASTESEIGGPLLHYYFAPLLGQSVDTEIRARDAQHVLDVAQAKGISLTSRTQMRLLHFIVLHLMNTRQFQEAQALILESCERLETLAQREDDLEVITTLRAMYGRLMGTWSDQASEEGKDEEALALREQAAAILQECVGRIEELEERTPHWHVKQSSLKYRRARYLTNLGYHLGLLGHYEKALVTLEQSIDLKQARYAERGSLAAALGEKAQVLMHLGRFQEALDFDQQARDELQRLAESGHTSARDERWVYDVDRACLLLRLGKVDEAEGLLQEAQRPGHIVARRREYETKAQKAMLEIQQWRAASPNYQLDWRWSARYRDAINYDPFRWLTPAGPFTSAEQEEWRMLTTCPETDEVLLSRSALLSRSKDRELAAALSEGREPELRYPAIPIDDLRQRQSSLQQIAAEVRQHEPNAVVSRLYLDAIEEQLCYMRMIQATHEGDGPTFFACNRQLHPEPSRAEMESALIYALQLIQRGLQHPATEALSAKLHGRFKQLSIPVERYMQKASLREAQREQSSAVRPAANGKLITPQVQKRFFEAVLDMYGFTGWVVVLDPSTNDTRIEPNVKSVIVPTKSVSVTRIRTLLSHEIESHVFRNVAGERSPLALLGLGTKGSLETDEGLAQYFDQETALVQGTPIDESDLGFWIGTLATGLASGVLGPPLPFSALFGVFELVFAINRLLKGIDKDVTSGLARVRELAFGRCLRTYRGVPDLRISGHAYVKDAIYLRGYRAIRERVQQDNSVLTRLMVGIVALEQLDDLKELGIVSPPHPPRWLAHDPEIESFILSFEDSRDHLEVSKTKHA